MSKEAKNVILSCLEDLIFKVVTHTHTHTHTRAEKVLYAVVFLVYLSWPYILPFELFE
jgi:hypothetical protein